MRRLFLAASALALCALAGCGRQEASDDRSADVLAPPAPPAATQAPPQRTLTQASAVSDGDGAYGMPHAPIPYDKLGAYEQQQDQPGGPDPSTSVQPGQPAPPPPSRSRMSSKPRSADTVFY